DVFIDPLDDNDDANYPRPEERRWRTVIVAGLREGGHGYYALDVTQPDKLIFDTATKRFRPDYGSDNDPHQPTCLSDYSVSDCGPVQFGAPLWEFTDNTDNQLFVDPTLQPALPYRMDEDRNSLPDIAFTWSQPDFARVQICEGSACTISPTPSQSADVKEHFVVFFGGGLDVDHKDFDPRHASARDPDGPGGPRPSTYELQGNWIYMVDVETGEVLYKRQLCSPYLTNTGNPGNPCVPAGSVPSAIAAVDTDLNGFVDRLYVGTTGGYMFRVDLQTITTTSAGAKKIDVPALASTTVNALDLNGNPAAVTVKRIPEVDGSGNPIWRPYVIFDANYTDTSTGATATALPRPVYFAPAVVIYQNAGAYALAFGTGDRDDLWNANQQPGRFYVFMDDTNSTSALAPAVACPSLAAGAICPRTEADYQSVPLAPSAVSNVDFLLTRLVGRRGWYLTLPGNERVITDTFSFSGLTFFSSYQPQVAITDENGNPLSNVGTCGQNQYERNTDAHCAKTGVSSLFLVSTVNGNGLLPNGERTKQVASFVTNPFTQLSTGNTGGGGPGPGPSPTPSSTPPPIPPAISDLFPKTCRFANARIDISTIAADTSLQELGSVPICMTQHSWKEF
ncbi:MAG TPA: hypothetical protein VFS60_13990, partial [Thermoanaerobaculia bacterium]|nr:hypothetical protein [Thermoanaerobaculia bacterium]